MRRARGRGREAEGYGERKRNGGMGSATRRERYLVDREHREKYGGRDKKTQERRESEGRREEGRNKRERDRTQIWTNGGTHYCTNLLHPSVNSEFDPICIAAAAAHMPASC